MVPEQPGDDVGLAEGKDLFPVPRFRIIVVSLCLFYLAVQLIYIFGMPLAMDEFDGAYDVNLLRTQMPYRDFRPYKTVLGYYIQLPALVLARGLWDGLLAVKCYMALINTFMMLVAALVLSRHNRRISIIASLALLCSMSTYLERSSDLRVDMLTAWAGLGSLLFLIHRKAGRAGLLAAISFLISQKGIYYLVAANATLLVLALSVEGKRQALFCWIKFNGVATAIFALYIMVWAGLTSFGSIINIIFFSHHDIALGYLYDIRLKFWLQTLRRNPLFYAMAAFSLVSIVCSIISGFIHKRNVRHIDLVLLIYGTIIAAAGVWHHQPWPYFFVILIPTMFVLQIRGFDTLIQWKNIGLESKRPLLWLLIVGFGILYPLTRLGITLRRDSSFQKHMVTLGSRILDEGETYIAGIDMIYNRRQYPPQLRRLDSARLERLKRLSVVEKSVIILDLEKAPPKLLFDNYRTQQFPDFLKAYLDKHYLPFWGCIRLYAPIIDKGMGEFRIPFAGTYKLLRPNNMPRLNRSPDAIVTIDNHIYKFGENLALYQGYHHCSSAESFRLMFVPRKVDKLKDISFRPSFDLFPNIYTY